MWVSAKLQEESRSTNKMIPCRVKIIHPADYKWVVPKVHTTASTCKIAMF